MSRVLVGGNRTTADGGGNLFSAFGRTNSKHGIIFIPRQVGGAEALTSSEIRRKCRHYGLKAVRPRIPARNDEWFM